MVVHWGRVREREGETERQRQIALPRNSHSFPRPPPRGAASALWRLASGVAPVASGWIRVVRG
jgi:hypothetical protein